MILPYYLEVECQIGAFVEFPIIIATLITVLFVAAAYYLFVPRSSRRLEFKYADNDSGLVRGLGKISDEMIALLPESTVDKIYNRNPNKQVERLLIMSGNPWNITPIEFVFLRNTLAIFGLLVGFVLSVPLYVATAIPFVFFLPVILSLLMFLFPTGHHKSIVSEREIDYKKNLPEALDLLLISVSGGHSFQEALRDMIPSIRDGYLKNSFEVMRSSLDAGKTMNETLNDFTEVSPNDSILTFSRAMQTALNSNTPIAEIMASQAESSRADYFAYVRERVISMESAIWAVLSPGSMLTLFIVIGAPAVATLMNVF